MQTKADADPASATTMEMWKRWIWARRPSLFFVERKMMPTGLAARISVAATLVWSRGETSRGARSASAPAEDKPASSTGPKDERYAK